MRRSLALAVLVALAGPPVLAVDAEIPLPEHPRPGFERVEWVNLNGPWRFRFDPRERGEDERWFDLEPTAFSSTILVPFPWGSPLSGVADEGDVAWYGRRIRVPASWKGRRVPGRLAPRGADRSQRDPLCALRRPLKSPRLWSLEDPHLYDAAVVLRTPEGEDRVKTYFGMREISTTRLPGLGHPYVSLNGRPVYLQMALDQGWHPEGFTTWPSDAVMKEEVLLARRLGLNTIRTHVKIEPPRKLYWADRLGVLQDGRTQGEEPMLNSECGNVWGYEGSTGDVDWSFDYHAMIDEFRRHPKVAGWLYTEHHDVINEWNGYVRADRSAKETGLGELVPGMSLRDLHAPFYVAVGSFPTTAARPGEVVPVPLWASFLTDVSPGPELTIRMELVGHDDLGRAHRWWEGERTVPFAPWTSRELEPMAVPMPAARALAVLRLVLEDPAGRVLHRNFTAFVVGEGPSSRDEVRVKAGGERLRILRVAPSSFADARWTVRRWDAMDGRKVNGAGSGVFEYRIPWPGDLRPEEVAGATFLAELGAKVLFGKDRPDAGEAQGDYIRGKGAHDPGLNPNAYPMTDTTTHPSAVRVRVGGVALGTFDLADDPADHRGLLSWHSQKRDGRLREAGSYGELVSVTVPAEVLAASAPAGEIAVRLEVDEAAPGGLAVYGEEFGRYPLDPTVVLTLRR